MDNFNAPGETRTGGTAQKPDPRRESAPGYESGAGFEQSGAGADRQRDSITIAFVANKTAPVTNTATPTWAGVTIRLGQCAIGPKDGPGWVPADIDPGPRAGERVRAVTVLVLDIEAKTKSDPGTHIKTVVGPEPPEAGAVAAELSILGWDACLHTSHSHLDPAILPAGRHPRYRIVIRLSRPLLPAEVRLFGLYVLSLLGLGDCADLGCLEPARLFYLPRVPAERRHQFEHHLIEGNPLDVDTLFAEAQRESAAARANPSHPPRTGKVIGAFNAAHDIGALLEQHGYIRKGRGRWLHPESTTGAPGVRVLPDTDPPKIFSSHGCDALANGHAHDAFSVFAILDYGGDIGAAVRAAAELPGMSVGPARAKNSREHDIAQGTEGTGGTASNGKGSGDLGSGNREGTGGTGHDADAEKPREKLAKPEVTRPGFAVHDDWTGYGPPGLYWHGFAGKGDAIEDVDQWVCSPLYADAIAHGERDADYGLLLRFQNACGRWREWSMPMRLLKGSGEELRGELLDLGVRIDPASHRLLNSCLMGRHPKRRILAATSTGWHGDGSIFVLPERIIGTGEVRYQSEHAQHDAFGAGGTMAGWQTDIASRCRKNAMPTFAVSAALAGPLLAKVHRTGCGFHFVGDSSIGKSTLLNAGASCWGGAGFIRTWKATGNGLEGIAAVLTDTALILDEISEADPREIGAIVYSIGNGTGKSRGARTGGAKAVQRWRVVLLSSGERTLAATMKEGGKVTKAGQQARLLDVPCTRSMGVFDTLHDLPDGRALSDTLRTAAAVHYGHAGPAFVARMIADPRDWGTLYAETSALPQFAASNELEGRAAGAFALVALSGELATEWGIVPWDEGDALDAAAGAFAAWKADRPKGHTETRQILQAVGDFIAAHGDSRFSNVDTESHAHQPVIRDRAGWWRDDGSSRVFLFTPGGLREASPGFDFRRVLEALDTSGWIVHRDDGRRSKKTKVQGRAQNLYAITPPEDVE